jgi:hypothetical protein
MTTMKNIRTVTICAIALALFPLGGCLEIAVKTKIADDGSSERTISVKRPTKTLPEHGYPVPSGSTWASEWKETGEKDLQYEYVATKRFATPEELASEYSGGPDTGSVRISISLERSFEWFYTYVDYRETYTLRNPFERIPARTYFTPDEINRIALGEKSDSLNGKIEEWDYRNQFEEYYVRLQDAIGDGEADVNHARLEGVKEEMFRLSRADTADKDDDQVRHTMKLFEKALGTRSMYRHSAEVTRVIAEVDSMAERRRSADSWVSSVVMPGLLVSANGETVEGNEVHWKIGSKQLLVTSVLMGARSRVTNTWAFAVTGAAALLLLVPAVFGLLRRRNRR